MRRSLLVLYVLVGAWFATSTVHAQEISAAPLIECTGVVHSGGDAEKAPGDMDKGIAHHHGMCHSVAAVVRDSQSNILTRVLLGSVKLGRNAVVLPRWTTGPLLRPPIA